MEGSRILVVDDNTDLRQLLALSLQMEGFEIDEAASAHEALGHLQNRRYDLILTDYSMPGATGGWMLNEAVRRGILGDTPAVIVSAHAPSGDHWPVVSKPFDLDKLIAQVRRLVRRVNRETTASGTIELVLYVSGRSAASILARKKIERVLKSMDRSKIRFVVRDVAVEPHAAEEDRITFTPTLVKRQAGPTTRILGNFKVESLAADLLAATMESAEG